MKIAIATFVKTPGLSPIKTRLAASIGVTSALEFYVASLGATYTTVESVAGQASDHMAIQAFWSVAEEKALKNPFWSKWPTIWQGEGELGARLAKVYSELREKFEVVCFYGADSPHISAERLLEAIQIVVSGRDTTAVGPTEDGGFYFLVSSLEVPTKVWTSVQYSQNSTLAQLREVWPSTMTEVARDFDVDTVEDLERLKNLSPPSVQ